MATQQQNRAITTAVFKRAGGRLDLVQEAYRNAKDSLDGNGDPSANDVIDAIVELRKQYDYLPDPTGDEELTSEERRAIENGNWHFDNSQPHLASQNRPYIIFSLWTGCFYLATLTGGHQMLQSSKCSSCSSVSSQLFTRIRRLIS